MIIRVQSFRMHGIEHVDILHGHAQLILHHLLRVRMLVVGRIGRIGSVSAEIVGVLRRVDVV
jgi:hypothetical protein